MKFLKNMNLQELQQEQARQQKIYNSAVEKISKINGVKDYSDEVSKYFHLGMVGFRKDTKRQVQTIDKAVKNGVEACKQYEIRDNATRRLDRIKIYIKKYENK